MEEQLLKELDKIVAKERFQAQMTKYINSVGKWLLYILPLILLVLTLLSIFTTLETSLLLVFIGILVVYGINSFMLVMSARTTKSSLKARLGFERKRGRPIDSLEGFDLLESNVNRVIALLEFIALVCIVSLVLFIAMIVWSIGRLGIDTQQIIGFLAAGFALVGLGMAVIIRSLNLNIHDVNGLQDFYSPTTHEIFLDNFFCEVFASHLDPVTYLKFDEYLAGVNAILKPNFVQKIKEQEPDELPITFAMERILFLYYLKFQDVIDDELFSNELGEVIDVTAKTFDLEKGLLIENEWYFSVRDVYKLFNFIKKHNPGFFSIIDRLQLELSDNIERVSKDPIYMDSATQELVNTGAELNIIVYLYNNNPESKRYKLKIFAPGFTPKELVIDIEVEGRGSFLIPDKPIPLTSKEGIDITTVLSTMLENGDSTWVTLEPKEKGEQTIQIFLESESGTIIEGKTRVVKVKKDFKQNLKKLSSVGSLVAGAAVPLAKILPSMLSGGALF